MILDKLTYNFRFDGSESDTFVPVLEDVFYLQRGKKYKQFNKGQMIPKEIFDVIFPKVEKIQEKENLELIKLEVKKSVKSTKKIKK